MVVVVQALLQHTAAEIICLAHHGLTKGEAQGTIRDAETDPLIALSATQGSPKKKYAVRLPESPTPIAK